jgi:hypothetical protein
VASALAHEKTKKLKAEYEANEEKKKSQDTEKVKDCLVNKFDGLCHDADGSKYHPQGGYKAMGVNQWVAVDSENLSQKHHDKKMKNKE